jgi:ABC-type branched-subunit amino acid transport system substrate-binding protein
MTQKKSRLVAFALGALFLTAGCSGAAGRPGETIRIGAIADLSRQPGSFEGQILRSTLDSTVAQINASGGINGRPLQIVYVDPRDDPAEALAQARRLVSQGQVDVLYGGTLNSECAAVQEIAGWVRIAYVMGNACRSEELTARTCNQYSFRLMPAGRQVTDPLAAYITDNLGKRWAVIYPDYLPGRSEAVDWRDSLNDSGAIIATEIAVPVGVADLSRYLSTIPADNSISGIVLAGSAGDQGRLLETLYQIGIAEWYPIVGSGDWATYRDVVSSAALGHLSLVGIHPVDPYPGDQKLAGAGASNDEAAIMALEAAMIASDFTGRADTRRLIAALENLPNPGSADAPIGPDLMDKTDHQGRMEEDILKIHGQSEEVVQHISPGELPMIGNCQV